MLYLTNTGFYIGSLLASGTASSAPGLDIFLGGGHFDGSDSPIHIDTNGVTTVKAISAANAALTLQGAPGQAGPLAAFNINGGPTASYIDAAGVFVGNVTGNVSGTAGTITGNLPVAQITGLGSAATHPATDFQAAGSNIPESQVTGLVTDLAARAPLASPAFTGRASIPAHVSAWNALPAAVGGTITIDWSLGDRWYGTLASGATTIAYTGLPAAGSSQVLLLRFQQPASGAAGTINWPGISVYPGGTAPATSTTNGKVDLVTVSINPAGTGCETVLSCGGL